MAFLGVAKNIKVCYHSKMWGEYMKKIKALLSKWWFYLILFIFTLVVPFVINKMYKMGAGYITLWDASDVLSFYGSYLSFFGTVILGIVAVYQNKMAYQLNEQLQKLQQAQFTSMVSIKQLEISKQSAKNPSYRNPRMTDVQILDLTAEDFDTTQSYHIDIEFENQSDYPIVQIIANGGSRKNSNCMLWGMVRYRESAVYIPAHGKSQFRLIVPCEIFEAMHQYQCSFSFNFINIFDYGTLATVHLPDLSNVGKKNEYTYRLAKFTDIRA